MVTQPRSLFIIRHHSLFITTLNNLTQNTLSLSHTYSHNTVILACVNMLSRQNDHHPKRNLLGVVGDNRLLILALICQFNANVLYYSTELLK